MKVSRIVGKGSQKHLEIQNDNEEKKGNAKPAFIKKPVEEKKKNEIQNQNT